jgi:hypothetical protein
MVEFINDRLETIKKPQLMTGELLKLFGVLILGNRHEFGHRADLCKPEAGSPLLQAPAFDTKTGMPRTRIDDIWSSLTSTRQGDRGDEECSAAHRWRLVSEFVESIHSHRSAHFSPSELICVDESIARWYGQGGHWIEHGLPQYVAIDRKQENGCEIQKSAYGRGGIMKRASSGNYGRARGDTRVRGRGWPQAWHGRSGPACAAVAREGGSDCVCGLVFCECRGRAAPAGPRSPVHRGSQDRAIVRVVGSYLWLQGRESTPTRSVCSLPEGRSNTCHTRVDPLGGHVSLAGHV